MPLEQAANNLTFYAFYTYAKQGVAGLTVTADVYRSGTSILTAQACTAVGGGLYSYTLSSASVTVEGEYICLFKTAGTVDQQHIPAIWCIAKAGVEYLDAQVTSRAAIVDYTTARAAKLDNLDATISSRLAPADITSLQADVTAIKTPVVANLDTTVSSRLTPAGITNLQADVTAIQTSVTTNLDATISSRLAPADITSLQADVTAIKTPVVANVDATISSRLASSAYTPTTAMSADVTTILSRTDVATSTRASGADYTTARAAKLDRLDVAVSSRVSAGTGAIAYTTTVTAPSTGTPIEGVAVWVTSDSAGANVIAGTQYTSAIGVCTFMLDAGSYYMWLQKTGWNFSNPVSIVVST